MHKPAVASKIRIFHQKDGSLFFQSLRCRDSGRPDGQMANPIPDDNHLFTFGPAGVRDIPAVQQSTLPGMEEYFTITLMHKGKEQELEGRLRISAYTHQFLFTIGDSEIILERDDEGHFRARTASASPAHSKMIDEDLVRALIAEMEKNL